MCILSRLCCKTQTDLKITRITYPISSSRQVHPELQLTRRSKSCSRKKKKNDLSSCKFILKLFPAHIETSLRGRFPSQGLTSGLLVTAAGLHSQPWFRDVSCPALSHQHLFPPGRDTHPSPHPSPPLHSPLMSSRRSEVEQQIFLFLGGLLFFAPANRLNLWSCYTASGFGGTPVSFSVRVRENGKDGSRWL